MQLETAAHTVHMGMRRRARSDVMDADLVAEEDPLADLGATVVIHEITDEGAVKLSYERSSVPPTPRPPQVLPPSR